MQYRNVSDEQRQNMIAFQEWLTGKGYQILRPDEKMRQCGDLDILAVPKGSSVTSAFHIYPTDRGRLMVRICSHGGKIAERLNGLKLSIPADCRHDWRLCWSKKTYPQNPFDNDRQMIGVLSAATRQAA